MDPFQKYNNLTGWGVFFVALTVYWLTLEPTASYWDCGEFIAASYKLQVPHPPGAPLFLLMGRLFSFLSLGDTTQVAYWINFSSALSGAFTSLFLFWSVTLVARALLKIKPGEAMPANDRITVLASGVVGALSYTFCDSAWFSSVEAEVYALSSFFTAFVVWAMLKWQVMEEEAAANRWLIFIFYMIGLSIGVHLLNLVTIPALALLYYFKHYRPGKWGVMVTLLIGIAIIFTINDLVIPGLPSLAGAFEIFFVNSLGFPFGSGAIIFILLFLSSLVLGIYYTQRRTLPLLNTFLLATTFILIGYSSYTTIMIRANQGTHINENDPSDLMSFVRYLKREQYGARPLLYGPYFTARVTGYEEGTPVYIRNNTKYEVADHRVEVKYNGKDQTILPRIWSTEPAHQKLYRDILDLKEGQRPTFIDNVRYFFTHQVGWMYVRYFFFNFAGRESDEQDANWLRPAQWFAKLPAPLAENRGRNNFYMIPFVLGLAGMYYQAAHHVRNFFVLVLLFILAGVALVVYLNSPPAEPRERDYIYAGSYFAYSFWIGLSVVAFASWIRKISGGKISAILSAVFCLSGPALMAKEGWDDHNRSGRFFSVDSAINDLQSCAPDSIFFSGGDNDTFPLWYAQDVEGVRPDIRVIVLSYFNTSWYVRQAMRTVNDSKPFPFSLTAHQYRDGGPNNPYLPFYDMKIGSMDLKQFLELIRKEHPGLRVYPAANVIPSRDIVLKVDVAKVRAMGIVPATLEELIVPEMHLHLKENGLEMKDLALLDILATADWKRPVYVDYTSLAQFNVDLTPYVVREGNVFRILPVLNPDPENELVNTNLSYSTIMNKFRFRGLTDSTLYYSDQYRNAVRSHRNTINSVALALLQEGHRAKAKEMLVYSLEKMPDAGVRFDISSLQMFPLLLEVQERERAIAMAEKLASRAGAFVDYYLQQNEYGNNLRMQMFILYELQRSAYAYGEQELGERIKRVYEKYASFLQPTQR